MAERYLAAESIKVMAQKVAFVSFDVIQFKDHEMRSHWYRYEELDLYYFQNDDGEIVKIHISLLGQVVEWNPLDGLRTGLLVEQECDKEVFQIIQYDARPNADSVGQSVEILENAAAIEEPQRLQMLQFLQGQARVTKPSFFKKLFAKFSKKA